MGCKSCYASFFDESVEPGSAIVIGSIGFEIDELQCIRVFCRSPKCYKKNDQDSFFIYFDFLTEIITAF